MEEIAARFVGKAGVEYQAAVHEVLGPLPDNWREPYEEELEYALSNGLCPTDGIIEALRGIRLPMAVASNSAHSRVERSLDLTGSRHFFGGRVVGIDDVDRGNPRLIRIYGRLSCWVPTRSGALPLRTVLRV